MLTALTRGGCALLLGLGLAGPGAAADGDGQSPGDISAHWDMLDAFCTECHNYTDWAGEVAFDTMTPEGIPENADIWEEAIRKLRGGLMPPPGNPRPENARLDGFATAMEDYLDDVAANGDANPGHVGLHRLNRTEYANAMRDLLGIEIDPADLLPQDNSKGGFDNNASVLSVTPTFLEQYVSAARSVALTAIGDGEARPGSATYVNEVKGSHKRHIDGLPLGTRGGMVARHYFPADGEYVVSIADMATALWVFNMEFENTVVVTLDGKPVHQTTIGGEADQKAIDQHGVSAVDTINERLKNIRFTATAGPHDVGVTFLERTFAESDHQLRLFVPGGGQDRVLQVESFELQGPFNASGVSESEPRRRIFSCYPERAANATPCAEEILARLTRRAFRRPLTEADMQDVMAFYRQGEATGGFEAGIRRALTAVLASPDFLYRYAAAPEGTEPGEVYRLSDVELASRLSFFLWSSIPDDTLLDLAAAGRLSEPDVLAAQMRRMLADPRAQALVADFAFQWLDIDRLDEIVPDAAVFPYAADTGTSTRAENGDPRDAYRKELALFLESIIREDRPVLDILTADYTYLNERAALLYGIKDVRGSHFRRVKLSDTARFGLLGKGAVLMASSYPNRTAPVLRGQFILDNLLGAPPAPPPAGVDTDLTESGEDAEPRTVRERLALHSTDPSCNSCHGVMDPLGLALENFNAIGEWRDVDRFSSRPIDASGELPDGTKLGGPVDLRAALMQRSERFVQTFTEELMTFALGRTLKYYDLPVVRGIVEKAAAADYRFSALVLGIVESDAFRMRKAPGGETVQEAALQE